MRVLPLNCVNFQSKTNNHRVVGKRGYQQNPLNIPEKPDFNNKGTVAAATAAGVLLGGAALAISAPVAMVAGALLLAAPVALMTGAAAVKDIAGSTKPILHNMSWKI